MGNFLTSKKQEELFDYTDTFECIVNDPLQKYSYDISSYDMACCDFTSQSHAYPDGVKKIVSYGDKNCRHIQHLSDGRLIIPNKLQTNPTEYAQTLHTTLTIVNPISKTKIIQDTLQYTYIKSLIEFKYQSPTDITFVFRSSDKRFMYNAVNIIKFTSWGVKICSGLPFLPNMRHIKTLVLPDEIILFVLINDEFDIIVSYDGINYTHHVYDHLIPILKNYYSISMILSVKGRSWKAGREIQVIKNAKVSGKNQFLAADFDHKQLIVFSHDGKVCNIFIDSVSLSPNPRVYQACCYDKVNNRIVALMQNNKNNTEIRIFCNKQDSWFMAASHRIDFAICGDIIRCSYARSDKLIIETIFDVYLVDALTMKYVTDFPSVESFSYRDDYEKWYSKSLNYLLQNEQLKQFSKNLLQIILQFV